MLTLGRRWAGLIAMAALPLSSWGATIYDGGFEDIIFTGLQGDVPAFNQWTVAGSNPNWVPLAANPSLVQSGSYAAQVNQGGGPADFGYLNQIVGTVAGGNYDVSFNLLTGGGCSGDNQHSTYCELQLWWNGEPVWGTGANPAAHGYQRFTVSNLSATSPASLLEFRGRDDGGYMMLDAVSIADSLDPAPVPEPAGVLLCGAALLALGCYRRWSGHQA